MILFEICIPTDTCSLETHYMCFYNDNFAQVCLLHGTFASGVQKVANDSFIFIFLGAEYFPANTAPWFLGGLGLRSPP